jgi:hypothetical protein
VILLEAQEVICGEQVSGSARRQVGRLSGCGAPFPTCGTGECGLPFLDRWSGDQPIPRNAVFGRRTREALPRRLSGGGASSGHSPGPDSPALLWPMSRPEIWIRKTAENLAVPRAGGETSLCALIATHNEELAGMADRSVHLGDGRSWMETTGEWLVLLALIGWLAALAWRAVDRRPIAPTGCFRWSSKALQRGMEMTRQGGRKEMWRSFADARPRPPDAPPTSAGKIHQPKRAGRT